MLLHNCFLHLYHFLANISHSNAKVYSSPEKLSRNLLTRKSTEIFFPPTSYHRRFVNECKVSWESAILL